MQRFSHVLASSRVGVAIGPLLVALLVALFVSLFVALPYSPLPAQDAPTTRPVAVVVSGGAAVPLSGFRDYNDLGVHADVSLLLRVSSYALRLRPEFSYGRFALKSNYSAVLLSAPAVSSAPHARSGHASLSSADVLPGYRDESSDASTLLGFLGNIELPVARGVYLLVGVGATSVTSGATAGTQDVSQTGLTYNGGAGVRFRMGAISGFLEGRVKNVSLDQGRALFSEVRTIPVSFGLVF